MSSPALCLKPRRTCQLWALAAPNGISAARTCSRNDRPHAGTVYDATQVEEHGATITLVKMDRGSARSWPAGLYFHHVYLHAKAESLQPMQNQSTLRSRGGVTHQCSQLSLDHVALVAAEPIPLRQLWVAEATQQQAALQQDPRGSCRLLHN